MNTLELVRAITSGNSRASAEGFETLLNDRIAERINERRTQIAANMFTTSVVEESVDLSLFESDMTELLSEKDEGKRGLMFDKIAAKAAKEYGSKEAGDRVAGAIRKKILAKEAVEEVTEAKSIFDPITKKMVSVKSHKVTMGDGKGKESSSTPSQRAADSSMDAKIAEYNKNK